MFPLNANDAYIKETGERSTLGKVVASGGGGSLPTASPTTKGGVKIGTGLEMSGETLNTVPEVPAHTIAEAGKVLTVADDGSLEWDEKGTGGRDAFTEMILPVIEPRTNDYRIAISQLPLRTSFPASLNYNFVGSHTLDEVFLPESYEYIEFYRYLGSSEIAALNLTLLAEALSSDGVTEIVLNDSISSFDALLIQGCYDTTGASNYDTTIVYVGPQVNTPYWFGMRDRNNSYSGTITFSDGTHGTISAARRLKIYGFNM